MASMEGRTTLMQRPMGPRSINRSTPPLSSHPLTSPDSSIRRPYASSRPSLAIATPPIQPEPVRNSAPEPPSYNPPSIRPLNTKPAGPPKIKLQINAAANAGPLFENYSGGSLGVQAPYVPPLQPQNGRTIAPEPPQGLFVPKPLGKPSAPKIKLQIGTAAHVGPLFESYAGGPTSDVPVAEDLVEERTMRPESITMVPANRQGAAFDNLRELVTGLEAARITPKSNPEGNSEFLYSKEYSDSVFEELSRLGEGAGGAVHKVRHRPTGKIMARKTITTLEAPRRQLERELSIAAGADHPNIIKWFGVYLSPSSSEIKILMEFCEGRSLDAVARQMNELGGQVGEKIYGRLAEGILQGLNYLHSKKTIHRDIKPQNVLLTREGVVRLCDFGVSGDLVNSVAGTFTGTSMYMAPERISGSPYTIRSDVWSTGITLLELAMNRNPFPPDLSPIELMMYITSGDPPRLEDEDGRHWGSDMKDFIRNTLIVDSVTRPTPREMLLHPWINTVMKQEVNMARWMRTVWGWPKTGGASNNRRSQDRSRPGTGHTDYSDQ